MASEGSFINSLIWLNLLVVDDVGGKAGIYLVFSCVYYVRVVNMRRVLFTA